MSDKTDTKDPETNTTHGSRTGGIVMIGSLLLIVLLIILGQQGQTSGRTDVGNSETPPVAIDQNAQITADGGLPKLLDLGSVDCIPCKMMEPVLKEMTEQNQGQLIVEFIDVRQDRAAGERYGIRSIPTQIFFDRNGIELFRHIGFYSKEEILSKWKELGYEFQ